MCLYDENVKNKLDNPIVLTRKNELELIDKHNNGDPDATVTLISSMQHVSNYMVMRARKSPDHNEDLYQCAMIGCLRAIAAFDPKRGNRLVTVAKQYIRSEIDDFINKSTRFATIYKTKDERKVFYSGVSLTPTDSGYLGPDNIKNISKELNVDTDVVSDVLNMILFGGVFHGDVESFNEPLNNGSLNHLAATRNKELLFNAMLGLNEVERDIVTRFYLNEEKLVEIGKAYGLSAQAIFKVKDNALLKLKTRMGHKYDEVVNG